MSIYTAKLRDCYNLKSSTVLGEILYKTLVCIRKVTHINYQEKNACDTKFDI